MFLLNLAQGLLFTAVPLLVVHLYLNIRRHKGIPGPFLASLTDLWRAYMMDQGYYTEELKKLHEKHGNLVRVGPNTVSVNDPAALPTIYGTHPVWIKADSYRVMIAINKGKEIETVVSTFDENKRTAMQRAIGNAFATHSLLDYEHYIDESAEELFSRLSKLGSGDIWKWLQYFTMDVLSRVAFSESLGFVEKGIDVGGTIHSIETRFDHWNRWAAIPHLERLVFKNPIMKRISSGGTPLAALAAGKFHARKAASEPPSQRDLLQKYIEALEKHPKAINESSIIGITMSTIAAGADTTAVTLSTVFFYLLKNPRVHDKLMAEFQVAVRDGALSNPPRWTEVNKLPYLEVVVKESMRCWPIAAFGIDRIVPKGGVEISGTFLSEGTTVGVQQTTIHLKKDVWGEDSDVFRPERWTEADEGQRKKMERGYMAFSQGKRVCLGMHIAWLEMKKVIPHMMLNFKMELIDQKAELKALNSSVRYPEPIYVKFEERALN